MLLLPPPWCLPWRAGAGEVTGFALEAKATGSGHRVIAGQLGRPASTVRGWLRSLAGRTEQVRSVFTALAVSLVTDPPLPAPVGSPLADTVAAVAAAAAAAAARVPGAGAVAPWEPSAAVTCGLLLAPSWRPQVVVLAVGEAVRQPVVRGDQVTIATTMTLACPSTTGPSTAPPRPASSRACGSWSSDR